MADYEKDDEKDGDAKFDDAQKYYGKALKKCAASVTDTLDQWETKMEDLTKIKDWDKLQAKIYADNKATIDADTGYMFKSWDEGVYFNAGLFAGRIDQIFLANAPAEMVAEVLKLL